ncbi:MAG: glycerol-3-phosphate acyltransferase, partial [Solirubrobacteraceae bacterium]
TLALLGSRGVALTFDRIEALTAPLLDYVEHRELPGPVAELRRPAGLRRGLDSLVDAGVLSRYDGGTEPVWSIADGGHHVAAFYRNGTLHHVVNRAICEVALLRASRLTEIADVEDHGWREALAIRDLLKFEFFFADKPTFRDQIDAELQVLAPDWRTAVSAGRARELLTAAPMVLANRALRSFADAQLVVAERLAERDPRSAVDRDAFLGECYDVGRQMLLQRRILTPEAVGRELFIAALDLAANRDLVDPGRDEVAQRRRAWVEEIEALRRDLTELHELDRSREDEATDDDHR